MRNIPHKKLLEAEELKSDLEVGRSLDGIQATHFTSKKTLLDVSMAEEGLKKLDSFNRWMSKELGDVEESSKKSTSSAYWDTVETENGVDSRTIPSLVHLENYVLDPSICYDQLFSIIDYSPCWTFEDSEIKVFYCDILHWPSVLIICSLNCRIQVITYRLFIGIHKLVTDC
jgi:hypothetical protein